MFSIGTAQSGFKFWKIGIGIRKHKHNCIQKLNWLSAYSELQYYNRRIFDICTFPGKINALDYVKFKKKKKTKIRYDKKLCKKALQTDGTYIYYMNYITKINRYGVHNIMRGMWLK